MGICYARLNLTDPLPTFKTLQGRKSTKFHLRARMCQHLLSRDDAPEMVFENGEATFPLVPAPTPAEHVIRETKIPIKSSYHLGVTFMESTGKTDLLNIWLCRASANNSAVISTNR